MSWSAGSGVDEYWLDIGTSQASNDIFSASQGLNRVLHLRGLPTDGSPVWARVWSRFGEEWEFRDAAYTVRIPTAEQSQAEITSPEPGSTLTSGTVTFTWSAGSGANGYLLRVGTSPGGDEIFSASQSLSLGRECGRPPHHRRPSVRAPVYLLRRAMGVPRLHLYGSGRPCGGDPGRDHKPRARFHAPGATVTFTWSAGIGVDQFSLHVGTSEGATDLFSGSQGLIQFATVAGLPTDGSPIWVRLWSRFGQMTQFRDAAYTAASAADVEGGGGARGGAGEHR